MVYYNYLIINFIWLLLLINYEYITRRGNLKETKAQRMSKNVRIIIAWLSRHDFYQSQLDTSYHTMSRHLASFPFHTDTRLRACVILNTRIMLKSHHSNPIATNQRSLRRSTVWRHSFQPIPVHHVISPYDIIKFNQSAIATSCHVIGNSDFFFQPLSTPFNP